MVTVRWNFY